jgi:hypothetical protein
MMQEDVLEDAPPRWRCPICNRKCRDAKGVVNHMLDKHPNEKHRERIADWIKSPARGGVSQVRDFGKEQA